MNLRIGALCSVSRTLMCTLSLAAFSVSGCGGENSEPQKAQQKTTKKATTEKVKPKKSGGTESPPAEKKAEKASGDDADLHPMIAKTIEALKSYREAVSPAKPQVEYPDHTAHLKCFTKSQKRSSKDIKNLCKKIDHEAWYASREKRQNESAFAQYERVHYRIDYDWQSRMGLLRQDKSGCWDDKVKAWTGARKQAKCTGDWRLRTFKYRNSKKGHLYSAGSAPAKTELMTLIEAKKVKVPARFGCQVSEVTSSGKGKKLKASISCVTTDRVRTRIEISGDRTDVNIGDIVSAPFGVAPKSGMLLSLDRRNTWLLASQADAIKIEKAAECPSADSLAPHFCRFAGTRSAPARTFSACSTAGNKAKVAGLLKTWDRARKLEGKTDLMINATTFVLAGEQANVPVQIMRARYQIEANKKGDAVKSLGAALKASDKKRVVAQVAKIAAKAEMPDVEMSAYRAGCTLGDKRACKKLPVEPTE